MTHTPMDLSAGRLDLSIWTDPVIDQLGHDPRSAYAETFWLGIIGPSTLWFLRLAVGRLDGTRDQDVVVPLDVADTARCIGMSWNGGKHSPFARMIDRAIRFGTVRPLDPHTLAVRRRLPPLTVRQTERLPERLQQHHKAVQLTAVRSAPTSIQETA